MRILLLPVKKDNVISLNTFVHIETSSVIIIIIVIVCLQLLVTDKVLTKNTVEFCNSLLYIFLKIGCTCVRLDELYVWKAFTIS